jgi:GNAT superfamily N-acetyltransferase
VNVPEDVLALAEDLNVTMPPRPGDRRIEEGRYAIHLGVMPGPHGTVVQRLRLSGADVPAAIEEVRARLAAEGRRTSTWEVGPSATPAGLAQELLAAGMRAAPEPVATAMLLDRPLVDDAPIAEGVRVRPVESLEDFRRVQELFWACFRVTPDADTLAELPRSYEGFASCTHWKRWLAWKDGTAIAAADSTITPAALVLCGGATHPDARGQGAYRALLAARWDEAVRHGVPRLVTQAGAMSRPILQRLGFREIASIRIFADGPEG